MNHFIKSPEICKENNLMLANKFKSGFRLVNSVKMEFIASEMASRDANPESFIAEYHDAIDKQAEKLKNMLFEAEQTLDEITRKHTDGLKKPEEDISKTVEA